MSEFDDMKGGDGEDGGQVAYDQDDDRSESDFSDSEDDMGDSDTVRPCVGLGLFVSGTTRHGVGESGTGTETGRVVGRGGACLARSS